MRTCIGLLLLIGLIGGCGPSPTLIPTGGATSARPTDPPPGHPPLPWVTLSPAPATITPGPTDFPSPKPGAALASADEAIRLAQQKFPELKDIQKMPAGSIGASTDIVVQDRPDGWNVMFWKGSGDCPSGCINNHYWYLSVEKSGTIALAGEFVREFDSATNAVKTRGAPMWGVPRQ
jgi:hypothetical protein